jgi:prepilin-type N-terminal cleavage/methylation domain-containing protein
MLAVSTMNHLSKQSARPGRAGFTLLELLAVIAVIALLSGMSFAAAVVWKNYAARSATRVVVESVAQAIEADVDKLIVFTEANGTRHSWRKWDWNGDGLIDGDPVKELGLTAGTPIVDSSYTGITGLMADLPSRHLDKTTGRPVDSWRRPLHVAWAAKLYNGAGVGVWSSGPDGLTGVVGSPEAKDDIRSWQEQP